MTDHDDEAVYRCPESVLRPVPGSAIVASPTARRRMRVNVLGGEISAGEDSLGVTGPDPAKLSADEARRCFGVEQGAT
ncbi:MULTISPECIES: hypothetical protein [unclassified Methylobacterium]|uniref:hypothetical protein n=1 Tax=unclassified Methylobacterium TaxID=2615210 RepID=UPI000AF6751C|nr:MULTISPECIES: hypothetical protein [unclassified Methylobacterium]